MTLSLKSIPTAIPGNHHEQDLKSGGAWTSLTVWRKSLVLSCHGFTVIDCKGNLVFRVDNYAGRPEEVILMDGSGKPILTICRRKKLRVLADSWRVYEGEVGDSFSSKKPICCVKKHMKTLHPKPNVSVLAHVYHRPSDKKCAYMIEGSYGRRSCRVLDESRRVVAEIRRKEAVNGGVSFGLEVFVLIVRPGFNPNFAMAIVLLLDQMFS